MKTTILLLLIVLMLGCTSQTVEQASTTDVSTVKAKQLIKEQKEIFSSLYTVEQATEDDFSKAATRHVIGFSMCKGDAQKVNGIINLKINGEWKPVEPFHDMLVNTEDPYIREYTYLGRNEDLNKYLVAGTFHEDYQTYLVDMITGEVAATTWSEPVVSPDKKHLANISIPTLMESSPNGIQVWKVVEQGTAKVIEKYLEIEQQEWEPFEMCWESPQSILIKMTLTGEHKLLQGEPKQEEFSYLRLIIK